jgi:hypothetical protein
MRQQRQINQHRGTLRETLGVSTVLGPEIVCCLYMTYSGGLRYASAYALSTDFFGDVNASRDLNIPSYPLILLYFGGASAVPRPERGLGRDPRYPFWGVN